MRNELDVLMSLIRHNLNAIGPQYKDNGFELFTTRDDSQQQHRVTGWAAALPYDDFDAMEAMRDLHHATERMLHAITGRAAAGMCWDGEEWINEVHAKEDAKEE
ncbi:hypothetical protein HBI17_147570 [Parastagonospora nodorum]|nr:hypothetical protein HBH49_170760 [Parastagonospora nodorum]KAH4940417.1 hypothetical protein HBI79_043260 [Parastagonospora nodorum]KAH4986679.1 hypothetical protein HBI76_111740 [Parastagonospora nodorum]KAH5021061.1 hypothetical protein HBI74_150520 [Parastagonospora nodorum]KAH5073519.1 hypothetical protein HBH95_156870 [Parastagonospora nodorum]